MDDDAETRTLSGSAFQILAAATGTARLAATGSKEMVQRNGVYKFTTVVQNGNSFSSH